MDLLATIADLAALLAVFAWVLLGAGLWILDWLGARPSSDQYAQLVSAGLQDDAYRPPLPGTDERLPADQDTLRAWWHALSSSQRRTVECWAARRGEWRLSEGQARALDFVDTRMGVRKAFVAILMTLLVADGLLSPGGVDWMSVALFVALGGYVVFRRRQIAAMDVAAPPHGAATSAPVASAWAA